jgi:hypothetical protein
MPYLLLLFLGGFALLVPGLFICRAKKPIAGVQAPRRGLDKILTEGGRS